MASIGLELQQSDIATQLAKLVDQVITFHETNNTCVFRPDARRTVTGALFNCLVAEVEAAEDNCEWHE